MKCHLTQKLIDNSKIAKKNILKKIILPLFFSRFTGFSLKYANPDFFFENYVHAAKSLEKQLADNVETAAWFAIDFSKDNMRLFIKVVFTFLFICFLIQQRWLSNKPVVFRYQSVVCKIQSTFVFGDRFVELQFINSNMCICGKK